MNAKDNVGDTPLHYATFIGEGRLDAIKVLLASGADVNASNAEGNTPIMSLIFQEDSLKTATIATLEYLLASGADVNAKDNNGNTPLHFAASWGGMKAVKILLAHNANVNAANNKGFIPINYASGTVADALKNYWDARQ